MPRIRQDVTGSSYVTGSGFILRDPRLLIRENDDLIGSFPSTRRSGYYTTTGVTSASFNDNTTILFTENESPVFPSMLPRGSSFNSQSFDIAGEESDISVTAPIRSFQHPSHLKYRTSGSVTPFNENRTTSNDQFFLTGTDAGITPGFQSPMRSKVMIEIDITPQSDTLITRNVQRRNTAESQPVSNDNTGFYYFNFNRKQWEQIGQKDPATGGDLYYDYSFNASSLSGTFPMQFAAPYGLSTSLSVSGATVLGWKKIGTPSFLLGAPSLPIYHATASQAIRLSDYISEPFLLEGYSISLKEVNAQRVNGSSAPQAGLDTTVSSTIFKSGSGRDLDNYTFFMYRQQRANRIRDSLQDVSGSKRYLVGSASMTFWNAASYIDGNQTSLLHTPAFQYDFSLPFTDAYNVGKFTGSIEINAYPAVAGPQFLGVGTVPDDSGAGIQHVSHAWPGGTSTTNYVLTTNSFPINVVHVPSQSGDPGKFADSHSVYDSRPLRKFGGEVGSSTIDNTYFSACSNGTENSSISPYLFLPEDELVIGFDAGVVNTQFSSKFSTITGSFLRLKNKTSTLRLYGSLIQDTKERLPILNQNLTSDSVHEIIGAESIADQNQIEPVSSYYGSRLDEIISGTMATPISGGILFDVQGQDVSRRVVSKVSLGQASTTGSLQRFCKINNPFERTYDSYLPDIAAFLSGAVSSSVETDSYRALIWATGDYDRLFERARFWDKQFPYAGNPRRYASQKNTVIYLGDVPFASDPTGITGSSETVISAVDFTFRTQYRTNWTLLTIPTVVQHRSLIEGLFSSPVSQRPISKGTYRYGISSVTPEYSSFRVRSDHYGYFRDNLEQRIDTSFNGRKPPITCRFVSGSKVLNDAADTHCQNLSPFATSSLPFFDDDVARNRSDNPDETLLIVLS